MITCSSRTGSTFLVHLLRSHSEIMCYGEIYSIPKPNGLAGRYADLIRDNPAYLDYIRDYRDGDLTRFLYKIAFDSQDRRISGFKYKYGQLETPALETATTQIIQDTDIKIIHLVRRNLLARYLSQYIANKVTGFTMRLQNDEMPDIPPVMLDPQACEKDFDKAMNHQAKYRNVFSAHPIFSIFYEDLLEEPSKSKVISELLSFLEVSDSPLSSPTQKIIQKPMSEAISNYTQLCDYFSFGPYAHLFQN